MGVGCGGHLDEKVRLPQLAVPGCRPPIVQPGTRRCCCEHPLHEETETQRGRLTRPETHSSMEAGLGLNLTLECHPLLYFYFLITILSLKGFKEA